MTLCRLILPQWAINKNPKLKRVLEGEFTDEEIKKYNAQGYNIYHLPNHPSEYHKGAAVDGSHIDTFNCVFIDFDLKSNNYPDKDSFIEHIADNSNPTKIVDSGNGVHVYWKVSDLDAKSYLRLSRRLMRRFNTDEAVGQIFQLMRLPGTINTKFEDKQVLCELLYESEQVYTCEQLDSLLPPITLEDEAYCNQHYDKTYKINRNDITIDDKIPPKFGKLLKDNSEAKDIWSSISDDRSKNDYRLGHIMFANGFTKEEASSVLVNSAKALSRAPIHRVSYATNIIDKIWTFELEPNRVSHSLSSSVKDILRRPLNGPEGMKIPCWKYIDDTEHGFRLGHVLGLVAGSGVGKTAMALNIFMGFVVSNPDLDHFFCPLEETDRDIAQRWKNMCGDRTELYEKVHVLSNYDEKGSFRDLSLDQIKDHILNFQKETNKKVGCVVVDHIGVLCNDNRLGQDEGVKKIAKAMKGFAEETQTFLIMQSQTSRSKAGIGDLELDKDSAFGTSVFENFCDFLVTLWQPLKRVYTMGAPTIMSYKFCKIRHKNQKLDGIKEDRRYSVFFDPETQLIREIIQSDGDLKYWVVQATSRRKADKNSEILEYDSIKWSQDNG